MAKRKKRKTLPPLHINMEPDEALARFIQADPAQVEELIHRSKTRKRVVKKKSTNGEVDADKAVVSLRERRMRKRNFGR